MQHFIHTILPIDQTSTELPLNENRLFRRSTPGDRPIYYTDPIQGMAFVSDSLSQLADLPELDTSVDVDALADYLELGYIPAPRTIYKFIHSLPAGMQLEFDAKGHPQTSILWRPYFKTDLALSWEEALTKGQELLLQALQTRLEAHPDAAFMLSGGIDSGTLLGLAQKHFPNASRKAFTLAFQELDYDESELARETAQKNGVPMDVIHATPEDIDIMDTLIANGAQPFADSSLLASAVTMKHANGMPLVTGDGGDEIFGGYRRYQAMLWRHRIPTWMDPITRTAAWIGQAILPTSRENRTTLGNLSRSLRAFSLAPLASYASFQQVSSRHLRNALMRQHTKHDFLEDWQKELRWLSIDQPVLGYNALDILHYLPEDGCQKQSLASDYAGAELLSPLLDPALLDFAMTLPLEFRTTTHETKRLLRAIGTEFLPEKVLRQPKRGFGVPMAQWIRGPLSSKFRELVEELPQWDTRGLLNQQKLRGLLAQHTDGKANHAPLLWAIYCLAIWEKQHPMA